MKKYFFAIFSLIILSAVMIFHFSSIKKNEECINVYSWGEFISNGVDGNIDVNKKFTEETGIKVNYKTFQNNEELFAKLYSGGSDYDVIIPSDYMVSKLIENGMLEKLDFSNIPNYNLINEDFKSLNFDPQNEYSVPYMWGMVGIFYDKNEIKPEEVTWDILWNEKFKNRILMFDNARDSFAISLLRLGYSVNTKNLDELKQAANELIAQKPLVQAYVMDQIFNKIENHEAVLAPYYAGDAATIIKNSSDIGFVIPKSGSTRFVDSLCIPKNSKHKTLAEKYINFMCRTDIALSNVKHTGYSTPQKEAFNLLDEQTKNNKIFYPEKEVLDKSQIFVNLPADVNECMDKLWVEVKAGGVSSEPWVLGLILALFSAAYLVSWMIQNRGKKKS